MKLAVIPARGGSKRIPRKNIRLFCGKPIITWSIKAALDSGCFDAVVVSTDDAEIAEAARSSGAQVPFVRPPHLSDDLTGTMPVVRHAIDWFVQHGQSPTHVCCIYATAPFVRVEDLVCGLSALTERAADYALAVTLYAFPIQRALRLDPDDPTALLSMAQIRYRQGSLEEARKLVLRFNKLVTPNAESLWLALRVERRLGERNAEAGYANQLRRRFVDSREYQLLQRGEYD